MMTSAKKSTKEKDLAETPFFSVVIPTYNRASMLNSTIQSVLSQSFTNFELIIVDDGSTDSTRELIRSQSDERIKYFYIANSGGPAKPRNIGISNSNGVWICFLDSDDLWYKEKLQVIYEEILKSQDTFEVVCHHEHVASNGLKKLYRYGPIDNKNPYLSLLLHGNKLSTSATSVLRSFILETDTWFDQRKRISIVEDYDFWLMLSTKNCRFKFITTPLSITEKSGGGISSDLTKSFLNHNFLLKKHSLYIQDKVKDKKALYRKLFARLLIEYSFICFFQLEIRISLSHIKKGLLVSPLNFLFYMGYFIVSKLSKYTRSTNLVN
jgi:glycosyltransferase involved in cell wall biosynthesis